MVPQLTEQHFWALNYKKLTGKAYITSQDGEPKGLAALRASTEKERSLKLASHPRLSSTLSLILNTIAHLRDGDASKKVSEKEGTKVHEELQKVVAYTKTFSEV